METRPPVEQSALIADGDAERREKLATMLAEQHYVTRQAADGHEALARIETEAPGLVFCDQELAGHTARELCEYVHEFVLGRVAFVLMVAPEAADPERARQQVGADGVLRHPVARYELANLGRHLLALRTLERRAAHLQEENGELRQALAQKALIDPVTRFYRFDIFKHIILLEVKRAKRYGYPLAILLLAFDNFQRVSGYLKPDQRRDLYTHVRSQVGTCIRDIDIPLLFAEEKVLVVMPHTDLRGAAVVADRIRSQVGRVDPGGSLAQLKLTVSIAVASTEQAEQRSFGTLIREAMRGLQEAEFKGGDVVLVCRQPQADGAAAGECAEDSGQLGPRTFFV